MEKRGQLTLKYLIELVVAISLFSLFLYAGKVYGTGEIFQKAVVARDNAILINSFYSRIGNGYILYPADVSKFLLDYKGDKIKVSKFKDDPLAVEYSFVLEGSSSLNLELKNPEALVLGNNGEGIGINTDKLPDLNKVKCLDVETKGDLNKKILIDAGHGDGTELKLNGLDEAAVTSSIAHAFFIQAKSKVADIGYSRAGNIGENFARLSSSEIEDLSDKADIIINVHTGNYAHKKNTLKVYYSGNDYSKKMACLILNRILDNVDLDGANIIPDSKLRYGKINVLVEIGNMQAEKNNILADSSAINAVGRSIFRGIEDYYG